MITCNLRIADLKLTSKSKLTPFCNQKLYFLFLIVLKETANLEWTISQFEMSKHVSKSHIQKYFNHSLSAFEIKCLASLPKVGRENGGEEDFKN